MNTNELKFNIFLNTALEKKGYDIKELIKLEDKDLDVLNLSRTLIQGIKDVRDKNISTEVSDLESELKDKVQNSGQHIKPNPTVLEQYKDVPETVTIPTEEVVEVKDCEEKPVQIVRVIASTEVLSKVKEALQEKEAKTIAIYTKQIKSVLTEEELATLDPAVISTMINERIAEVKSK